MCVEVLENGVWGGSCGTYLACCGYIASNATVDRKATFERTESKISDQLFVFEDLTVDGIPSSGIAIFASKIVCFKIKYS